MKFVWFSGVFAVGIFVVNYCSFAAEIRTPPEPHSPRINGPAIFGVRPGHPFLYHIPATGDRPMEFSADNLPDGLKLNRETGDITGVLENPPAIPAGGKISWLLSHSAGTEKTFVVTLHAKNLLGENSRKFKIAVGETISLTPAMGWNSWNHYAERVSQEIVLANARAMADSGLINHGWTYINIDDTWQGTRGGKFNAIQPNEKFPDMKKLCDDVHALGLKIGIYSTPWTTSYAWHCGGTSENPRGDWTAPAPGTRAHFNQMPWAIGKYHFAVNDAEQWADWGIDYLKYDWNPLHVPETKEMSHALRHSGRDILFSLSNNLNVNSAPAITPLANSWRTTGDIKASWWSLTDNALAQVKWTKFGRPGHWNDPDMLEIGTKENGQPGLTPDEEYLHMTLWCLLASPLLLGNDLTAMDPFTLGLLENDEVLAVDQDELGVQARQVSTYGGDVTVTRNKHTKKIVQFQIWARPLADGSRAVGLFNFGDTNSVVRLKFADLNISGSHDVRDLWREKNLGNFSGEFSMPVAPHSAELVKIFP